MDRCMVSRALVLGLWLSSLATASWSQQSVFVPATTNTIPIAGTVAAQTRIITGQAGKSIYVTVLYMTPAVAGAVVTWSYGSGTNCATNNVALTGAMTLTAGAQIDVGAGYGTIIAVPAVFSAGAFVQQDLCVTISGQAAPGWISYVIF